ncbi:hypothetical protein GCM10007382_11110 [Salinibacterium xinjiangense]|uniref:Uncharacterized protein n=1 Tax=Salinibacterium xinjiangense TaxID=386302 RepID=A0A2C8Z665_9MICO|nr:hypothetical protein [Salinibacterium xinjiangense]GGK92679.1 hypothetical protein GCM10007382_11110 [Salinibacterium xinjiangense]SOE59313.1 hypothetical protein SAMN06296378_0920 [Salinibacterium xinjiangense]
MYDLPEDLVELLAKDDVPEVVEATLMQRAASGEVHADTVVRYPGLAQQVSLHDNAPASLVRLKPLAYADDAQLDRFLESVLATHDESAQLNLLARALDRDHDTTEPVESAWLAISAKRD